MTGSSPPQPGEVLNATLGASPSDRVAFAAARCTFVAILAVFPATSMVISLYGLALRLSIALAVGVLLTFWSVAVRVCSMLSTLSLSHRRFPWAGSRAVCCIC